MQEDDISASGPFSKENEMDCCDQRRADAARLAAIAATSVDEAVHCLAERCGGRRVPVVATVCEALQGVCHSHAECWWCWYTLRDGGSYKATELAPTQLRLSWPDHTGITVSTDIAGVIATLLAWRQLALDSGGPACAAIHYLFSDVIWQQRDDQPISAATA